MMEDSTTTSDSSTLSDSEEGVSDEAEVATRPKQVGDFTEFAIMKPGDNPVLLKTSHYLESEAMVVRLAPQCAFCAVGMADGEIQIFRLASQIDRVTAASLRDLTETLPCTDICFFSSNVTDDRDEKCLLSAYASGYIRLWLWSGIASKRSLIRVWKEIVCERVPSLRCDPKDDRNQTLCISISKDNKRFVSGGLDACVRVYNRASSSQGRLLWPSISAHTAHGHTSRITAIMYHPRGCDDPRYSTVFITASWDDTIRIWDEQQGNSLWEIYGPHIVGNDGMDIDPRQNIILTCTWGRDKPLLQLWAFPEIIFESSRMTHGDDRNISQQRPLFSLVYGTQTKLSQGFVAKFDPTYRYILFAGSNKNRIAILDVKRLEILTEVDDLDHSVYSAAIYQEANCKDELRIVYTSGKTINLGKIVVNKVNTVNI